MQNPFFNHKEHRLRALFRILLFIFMFSFAVSLPALVPSVVLAFILRAALVLGVYYLMFRFTDQRRWNLSGLNLNKLWIKECTAGIIIAGVAMGGIFGFEWLTGGLEITGFGWERNGSSFWLIPVLVFFVQMVSVGIYEEVMARGYLIPNITEGFTMGNITPQKAAIIAVLISSALFGFAHANNPNATTTAVLNIILAGVMLAIPFVITGRLALSVGIHFSWNFFQGGVFGFRVSGMEVRNSIIQIHQGGPEWLTGGTFGPEAGVIGIFGMIFITVLTVFYLKRTGVPLRYAPLFSASYLQQKDEPSPSTR